MDNDQIKSISQGVRFQIVRNLAEHYLNASPVDQDLLRL